MPEAPKPVEKVEPKLRLKTITFNPAPRIPGVRAGDLGTISCENPTVPLRGWSVVIKGALFVLMSPKGWKSGVSPRDWPKTDQRLAWEMPRACVFLEWDTNLEPDKVADQLMRGYASEPFGKPFETGELMQPEPPKPIAQNEIGDE